MTSAHSSRIGRYLEQAAAFGVKGFPRKADAKDSKEASTPRPGPSARIDRMQAAGHAAGVKGFERPASSAVAHPAPESVASEKPAGAIDYMKWTPPAPKAAVSTASRGGGAAAASGAFLLMSIPADAGADLARLTAAVGKPLAMHGGMLVWSSRPAAGGGETRAYALPSTLDAAARSRLTGKFGKVSLSLGTATRRAYGIRGPAASSPQAHKQMPVLGIAAAAALGRVLAQGRC